MYKLNYSIILIIFSLSGCGLSHIKVSELGKYSHLIQTEYKFKHQMTLHADLREHYNKNSISGFTVMSSPGYGGRFVAWSKKINKGTPFIIKNIRCFMNCYLSRAEIEIEIPSIPKDKNLIIILRSKFREKPFLIKDANNIYTINNNLVQSSN